MAIYSLPGSPHLSFIARRVRSQHIFQGTSTKHDLEGNSLYFKIIARFFLIFRGRNLGEYKWTCMLTVRSTRIEWAKFVDTGTLNQGFWI
jgi:Golgi nucleoside diphosphatase